MRTLIILLVIATGGFFWHRRHEKFKDHESLVAEAKNKEAIASAKEGQLKALQARIEPLRQGEAELKKPDGSPEQLEKDVLELRAALTAGAARLDSAEDDYLVALNELREQGKKQTFPNLKLPNGEVLRNAHITVFKEGVVMVGHEDGVAKLMSDELPEGWADKFAVEYVSRHSKAEIADTKGKVQEALLTPLDLKRAKLSEIDDRIKAVTDQLMAYSGHIRESRRQADQLIRDAYKIPQGNGPGSKGAANQRDAMFKQAKALEQQREGTREQYVELRKQKELLERERLRIRKMPISPQASSP